MQVYSSLAHTASVNSICFGPHELGLSLATASSDGSIAIFAYQQDGTWTTSKVREGSRKLCSVLSAVAWGTVMPLFAPACATIACTTHTKET